jgi:hypothetical protein
VVSSQTPFKINYKNMTTLTLQDDIKLQKTTFVNILDLYNFVIDNQLITEFWEFSKDNLDDYLLFDIEKAKKLPDFYFVNLK